MAKVFFESAHFIEKKPVPTNETGFEIKVYEKNDVSIVMVLFSVCLEQFFLNV